MVVAALRPSRRRPHSFETELQDRSAARVVDYQSSQLEKGMGDTELLLFNHEVILGQSGAPVLSGDAHDVVGFIEGQWLRPAAGLAAQMEQGATSIGAAVPIRYAIAVLQEKGISWHLSAGEIGRGGTRRGGGEVLGKSVVRSASNREWHPFTAEIAVYSGVLMRAELLECREIASDIEHVCPYACS